MKRHINTIIIDDNSLELHNKLKELGLNNNDIIENE